MINQAATTNCVAVQRRSVYTEEFVRYPILKDWYPILKDPRFITESLSGIAKRSGRTLLTEGTSRKASSSFPAMVLYVHRNRMVCEGRAASLF